MPSKGATKRSAARKVIYSPTTPIDELVETAPAVDTTHENPRTEPASRPRSKSQGAAALASQLLAESNGESNNNNNAPTRRRAGTRASISGLDQPSSSVFQFLDKDVEHADSEAPRTKHSTQPVMKDRKRKTSLAQSLHSDSGISIRGHSPDRASASSIGSGDSADYQPSTPPDLPFDAVHWKLAGRSRNRLKMAGAFLTDTESIADSPFSRSLVDLPESYYHSDHRSHPPSDPVEVPPMRKATRPSIDTGAAKIKDKARRSASAPDVRPNPVSSKPDEGLRPRVYRQFGDLNHRLICHLQEEIAQMEEDLSTLDELEAMQNSISDTQTSPRQKLLAAKLHDFHISDWSVLTDKRNELIEKLLMKTEQYNRSLCAYSKSIRTLAAASPQDLSKYRVAARGNLNKTDRRILGHEGDLVLVDPRQSHGHPNPLYSTVAAIFAAVLLPLLAFGAISEFFGRIVVVAFTGAAIAFWAAHGPPGNEHLIAPDNGWSYAAGYFGFMLVAAIFIP